MATNFPSPDLSMPSPLIAKAIPINDCNESICEDSSVQYETLQPVALHFHDELNDSQSIQIGGTTNETLTQDAIYVAIQDADISSQPRANQEFYTLLDQSLPNLSKDLYIEKLVSLTQKNDDDICMYRSILLKRARALESCPSGNLIQRRSTKSEESCSRYASDCYAIQEFINNDDPKLISDILIKKRYTVKSECKDDFDQLTSSLTKTLQEELAASKAAVQMLQQDVNLLKQERLHNQQTIKFLANEVENLKIMLGNTIQEEKRLRSAEHAIVYELQKEMQCLKRSSATVDNQTQRTYACVVTSTSPRNESNTCIPTRAPAPSEKRVSESCAEKQSTPSLVESLRQRETLSHDSNNTSGAQSLMTETATNTSGAGSYHESRRDTVTSGARDNQNLEPQRNDVQTATPGVQRQTNKSPSERETPAQTIDVVIRERKTNNASNQSYQRARTDPMTNCNYRDKPLQTERHDDETGQPRFESYNANDGQVPDDEPVFESVRSRKTRRYYVGGIASHSNKAGIIAFLKSKNVEAAAVKLISTNRSSLAAKLTVYLDDCDKIERRRFWPRRMYCRRWYSETEWQSKWQNYEQPEEGYDADYNPMD